MAFASINDIADDSKGVASLSDIADEKQTKSGVASLDDIAPAKKEFAPPPGTPGVPKPVSPVEDVSLLERSGIAQMPSPEDPRGLPGDAPVRASGPDAIEQVGREIIEHPVRATGNAIFPGVGSAISGTAQAVTGKGQTVSGEEGRGAGAAEALGGAAEAVQPFIGPAAIENPIGLAKGFGVGAGAAYLTGKAADAAGASPQTKENLESAAWWLPSFFGAMRPKAEVVSSPEVTGVAGEAFGGNVKGGVAVTPEAVTVKGKVGPFEGSKTFSRGGTPEKPSLEPPTIQGNPQPVEPAAVAASDRMNEAAQSMARANFKENPPPPAPPPPPPPMVTDQTAQAVAAAIKTLPSEQQAPAILEATQKTAESIAHHGGAVVDGEVHTISTPEQAMKVATKIVNAQISKHDENAPESVSSPSPEKPSPSTKLAQGSQEGAVAPRESIEKSPTAITPELHDRIASKLDVGGEPSPEDESQVKSLVESTGANYAGLFDASASKNGIQVTFTPALRKAGDSATDPKFSTIMLPLKGLTAEKVQAAVDKAKGVTQAKPLHEMSTAEFSEAAKRGKLNKATGKFTAEERSAKTPLRSGELAGYSADDIAHFYANRRGAFIKGVASESYDPFKVAHEELLADARSEGRATSAAAKESPAPPSKESAIQDISKGSRVSVESKPGTVVWASPNEKLGGLRIKMDSGETINVHKKDVKALNATNSELVERGQQGKQPLRNNRGAVAEANQPAAQGEGSVSRGASASSDTGLPAHGAGAASLEELARNREFFKVGKHGQVSTMGVRPDATLQAGEAVASHHKGTGEIDIQNQNGPIDREKAIAAVKKTLEARKAKPETNAALAEFIKESDDERRETGTPKPSAEDLHGPSGRGKTEAHGSSEGIGAPRDHRADLGTDKTGKLEKPSSAKVVLSAQAKATAEKFRKMADGLTKQIEEKQRSSTQNPTPKRNAQDASRRFDARNLERTQRALRALADAHEAGTLSPDLAKLRTKDEVHTLVRKYLTGEGGYYGRVESNDYADKSPLGVKLQGMIDSSMSPAELAKRENANKLRTLEQEVSLANIPGYFPTPKPVVAQMLKRADIQPGMSVLEPSAGKGDIADAVKEAVPDAKIDTVEQNYRLGKILELKGHKLAGSDFMEHSGQYDRIVMNPPFEKGADMEHVRRAFDMLKPGGKLVSVMSPHFEFAGDKKSAAFRDFIEANGGEVEKLPDASFKASGTGVGTRLVTIEKPAESPVQSSPLSTKPEQVEKVNTEEAPKPDNRKAHEMSADEFLSGRRDYFDTRMAEIKAAGATPYVQVKRELGSGMTKREAYNPETGEKIAEGRDGYGSGSIGQKLNNRVGDYRTPSTDLYTLKKGEKFTPEWYRAVVDESDRNMHGRLVVKAQSEAEAMRADTVAPNTAPPAQLESWKRDLAFLEENNQQGYNMPSDVNNRIATLKDNIRQAELAVKTSGIEKTVPEEKVVTDPDKNKWGYQREYFEKALNPVWDAWKKIIGEPGDKMYDKLMKDGRGQEQATKPPGFKQEYIRIEVPNDGKFLVKNTPYAINRVLKSAPSAFAKPSKTRETPAPRDLKTADPEKLIAYHEKELVKAQDDLKRDPNSETFREQVKAARENLAAAKKSGDSGPVLRSSLFGADIVAEKAAKLSTELYKQDVAPALEKAGVGLKDAAKLLTRAFYPRIEESSIIGRALGVAAPRDAVDAIMRFKGDQVRALADFNLAMSGIKKMFDDMPEAAETSQLRDLVHGGIGRINFIDNIQTGKKQPTEELQKIADALKSVMDAQRAAEQEAANLGRPKSAQIELSKKADYFHNWWEKKPGGGEDTEADRIKAISASRRPLEGSRGYNKQQVYSLKSGIEAGGKPMSTNPITILDHRLKDGMKFVAARQYWNQLKELGFRKFIAANERIPEGYEEVNDRIAKVYFPAESGEGNIQAGRWVVDENAARLINNFLSKDYIRDTSIGSGLMALKNASTALELALSPFHAVFETIEAASSQMSLGMLKTYNLGIREGDLGKIFEGMKDVAMSPVAPVTMAREGSALAAYIEAKARLDKLGLTQFGQTISGEQPHGVVEGLKQWHALRKDASVQKLLKHYPDLDTLVDDMFTGGMVIGQHADYQIKSIQSMKEAYTSGNVIGAILRSVPASGQALMHPLFNVYIPNLKYGLFLKQMSEQVAEHSAAIESGKMTRAELARKVVDSVENRFGELNFDNLFWNRTFKTAMQFMFRSVTWKLGNVREFGGAMAGQSKELGSWAWNAYHRMNGDATAEAAPLPRLDMKAAWLMSLMLTTVGLGIVASKIFTKKYPWELAHDHFGESHTPETTGGYAAQLYLETVHPRTGEKDSRGKPLRMSLPTYWKDIEHAKAGPAKYLLGSLSTTLSKGIDIAQNEDYFGNYVYNPNASWVKQQKQKLRYAFPTPFSISNFQRGKQMGDPKSAWLASFGFVKAPHDLDWTPAEKLTDELLKARQPRHTPEEQEQWQKDRERIASGQGTTRERKELIKNMRMNWLQRRFKSLTYAEAFKVYGSANDTEKSQLRKEYVIKRHNALKANRAKAMTAESTDE